MRKLETKPNRQLMPSECERITIAEWTGEIKLTPTGCGHRRRMVCPGCGAACDVLFRPPGNPAIKCRTCHHIRYQSRKATARQLAELARVLSVFRPAATEIAHWLRHGGNTRMIMQNLGDAERAFNSAMERGQCIDLVVQQAHVALATAQATLIDAARTPPGKSRRPNQKTHDRELEICRLQVEVAGLQMKLIPRLARSQETENASSP